MPPTTADGRCAIDGLYCVSQFELENIRRAPLLGHVIDDRYALIGRVGAGGMGAVYRAWQLGIEREVALKILRDSAGASETARRRFRKEAQVIAGLQSDYTVRVYDFGEVRDGPLAGLLYMVMDLVEGFSLDERLKGGPLLIEEIALVLEHVANSVDEAHAKGIVHRDLKPSNILLTEHQGQRRAKVIDFGIARTEDSRHTRVGGAVGTPAYMAPELWPSDTPQVIDGRADVYAMGVVLYQLLSGRKPFASRDVVTLGLAHREQAPPPLGDVDDPVVAFEPVVRRAMAKHPDARYPTLRAMFLDFERQRTLAAQSYGPTESFTWTHPPPEPEPSGTSVGLRGAIEPASPAGDGAGERAGGRVWPWVALTGLGAFLGAAFVLSVGDGPRMASSGFGAAEGEAPAAEPRAAEPRAAEPRAAEPRAAEPRGAALPTAEPRAVAPPTAEPQAVAPQAVAPQAVAPPTAEPRAVAPPTAEPRAAEPRAAEPGAAEPPTAEPRAAEPPAAEPPTAPPAADPPAKTAPAPKAAPRRPASAPSPGGGAKPSRDRPPAREAKAQAPAAPPSPGDQLAGEIDAALKACRCNQAEALLKQADKMGSGVEYGVVRDLKARHRRCLSLEPGEPCSGL